MGINDTRVSAITWAKALMMLRETNEFVHSDLASQKNRMQFLEEKRSGYVFFLAISFALFLSLLHVFLERQAS